MAEAWNVEGALLEEVKRRIREISEEQHELARRQRILTHAATQLRLGRAVPIVLAEIRDHSPISCWSPSILSRRGPRRRCGPSAASPGIPREQPGYRLDHFKVNSLGVIIGLFFLSAGREEHYVRALVRNTTFHWSTRRFLSGS
jgi:hypothetical protein